MPDMKTTPYQDLGKAIEELRSAVLKEISPILLLIIRLLDRAIRR